jgi:Protein of unknown function (DUF3592)
MSWAKITLAVARIWSGAMAACCRLALLGVWAGLVYTHNQAVFRAHAVPAEAVIEKVYAGASTVADSGVVSSDWYADVHFEADGRTARARVMLTPCGMTCTSIYRAGQDLKVFYNPENPAYAQLRPTDPSGYVWVAFLGLMGMIFLTAAVVNAIPQKRRGI